MPDRHGRKQRVNEGMNECNPHNSSMFYVAVSPFYREGNRLLEKLGSLPIFTYLKSV